jgi:hypothetical protein
VAPLKGNAGKSKMRRDDLIEMSRELAEILEQHEVRKSSLVPQVSRFVGSHDNLFPAWVSLRDQQPTRFDNDSGSFFSILFITLPSLQSVILYIQVLKNCFRCCLYFRF